MYEPILTIKKILSGEHYFFKNVSSLIVRYKGGSYQFDKDKITGVFGTKAIPIDFLSSSTEVYICSLDFKLEEENNED